MREVKRLEIPQSLKQNAAIWTKELLDEINKVGDYAKVADKFKNKYNQKDVKEILEKMYHYRCCYCEGLIGEQTYGRIEHLKPKSLPQFYQLTYSWNNLHWCCEVCNTRKGKQWNEENPILDASQDSISDHLKIDIDSGKYECVADSKRGETTILHTDMNRKSLIEARQKLSIKIKRYYIKLDQCKRKEFLKEIENEAEEWMYPSVVKETCAVLNTVEI